MTSPPGGVVDKCGRVVPYGTEQSPKGLTDKRPPKDVCALPAYRGSRAHVFLQFGRLSTYKCECEERKMLWEEGSLAVTSTTLS
jgi:hypothetical protein